MIGLGLGLTFARSRGLILPFDPSQLFDTATGLWFDGTELSTLWTDTAATTNVTSTTQQIALALDKSRGANSSGGVLTGLGAEQVTNGTFASNVAGWSVAAGATLTWDAGRARLNTTGSFQAATQNVGLTVGRFYLTKFDIDNTNLNHSISMGGVFLRLSSATGPFSFSGLQLPTSTAAFSFGSGNNPSAGELFMDNISVQELPGFHGIQTGASFRPTYQTTGFRYDGVDDRLVTRLRPAASGTLAARFNGTTAGRVLLGSQGATNARAFLALDASGRLAAGVGDQSTTTIFGGSDLRGNWHTGAVTWNGTTVRLYLNGAEVYSAPQVGTAVNTVNMMLGALSANGTATGFWNGDISDQISLDRAATPTEISNLHTFWSA